MDGPRMFALTRPFGTSSAVVGYGLVLPDGSAFSISWPSEHASIYSASSAEDVAELRRADLLWIGDQP